MENALKIAGYDVIKRIGRGSFGECFQVKRKRDKKIMAMKAIMVQDKNCRNMAIQEIHLLYSLDHPYILKYYDNVMDSKKQIIYIFTEFCSYGDLETVIKAARSKNGNLSEDYIWKVFCQLTLALHLCHKRGVIHRDIKPNNVFLNENRDAILGDFGVARIMSQYTQMAFTLTGCIPYCSPEILDNQGYTEKTDVWSLGCLIYELSYLVRPYHDIPIRPSKLLEAIKKGPPKPIPAIYSKLLQSTIKCMLEPKASARPAIKDFIHSATLASKYKTFSKMQGNANYLAAK